MSVAPRPLFRREPVDGRGVDSCPGPVLAEVAVRLDKRHESIGAHAEQRRAVVGQRPSNLGLPLLDEGRAPPPVVLGPTGAEVMGVLHVEALAQSDPDRLVDVLLHVPVGDAGPGRVPPSDGPGHHLASKVAASNTPLRQPERSASTAVPPRATEKEQLPRLRRPTSRVRNHVPPKSPAEPPCAKAVVTTALGTVYRRSQARATERPARGGAPGRAAIVGFGISQNRPTVARWAPLTVDAGVIGPPLAIGAVPPAMLLTSPPENAAPSTGEHDAAHVVVDLDVGEQAGQAVEHGLVQRRRAAPAGS